MERENEKTKEIYMVKQNGYRDRVQLVKLDMVETGYSKRLDRREWVPREES